MKTTEQNKSGPV